VYAQAFALIGSSATPNCCGCGIFVGRITGTDDKGVENYAGVLSGARRGIEQWSDKIGGCRRDRHRLAEPGRRWYFLAWPPRPKQPPREPSTDARLPVSAAVRAATAELSLAPRIGAGRLVISQARCTSRGTASILADEARHRDDVEGQCDTTLKNIAALIQPGRTSIGHDIASGFGLKDLNRVKVYAAGGRRHLAGRYRPNRPSVSASHADISFLNVDVVPGTDLLVEIEGICPMMGPASASGGFAPAGDMPGIWWAIWSSSCSGSPRLVGGCSGPALPWPTGRTSTSATSYEGAGRGRVGICSNVVSRAGRGS